MAAKSKILVIDDDTSTLEIIFLVLHNAGFEVTIDSKADLGFLDKGDLPDLIIIDNNLGGRSGGEICKQLKENIYVKHIPVILTSAMEDLEQLALEATADDFLSKPFDMKSLFEKIALHSPQNN